MAPSAMRSAVKGDVWSKSFRMAVNIAEWHPTEPEWNKAINCIQVIFAKKSTKKIRQNEGSFALRSFHEFFSPIFQKVFKTF